MTAFKSIAAAADLGPNTEAVVGRAAQLARAHGASLHLLHVFDARNWHRLREMFDLPHLSDTPALEAEASERLDALVHAAQARFGVEVVGMFCVGAAADTIAEQLEALHADLLVLGARSDSEQPGLGHVASRLLHAPRCPLLVVRAGQGEREYQSVLCAVDAADDSLRPVGVALSLWPKAHHFLLYALNPELDPALWLRPSRAQGWHESARTLAERRLTEAAHRWTGAHVTTEVVIDHPAHAVMQFSANAGVDAIAVGRHRQAGAAGLFLSGLAEHVLHHAVTDVLLVP